MRYLLLGLLVVALSVSASSGAIGDEKFMLGFGADVLVPTSDWKDVVSTGFGGSIRLQYNATSFLGVGVSSGFFTWNGKDSAGSVAHSNYSGVPMRGIGKVYFMPEGKTRLYVSGEAGVFFGKTSDLTIKQPGFQIPGVGNIPDTTITLKGKAKTEFTYAAGLGLEFPLAEGKTLIDISIRFDAIHLSGSKVGTASNYDLRAGVNFGL